MRLSSALTILLMLPSVAFAQQSPDGLALPETAVVQDTLALPAPGKVKLGGFLGERFSKSETNRLLQVDEDELLGGFRKRPGSHPWIGEHVGKWLHAASLTWASTGNPALRAKLDRVASGLMKTQEPDGYLGTYVPGKRFGLYPGADWDIWSHKYCLIGLLAYSQVTGNRDALTTCRRAGDLLVNTFGPGKKSILSAGTHLGMAATSVLEPVVLLYRATDDKRYLDFARYLVAAWEEPNGPHIVSALKQFHSVRRTANAKAYEMLSNLVGLCELYRVTGEQEYLQTALTAWEDVVAHRLYLTGTGSNSEHWQDDYVLPNGEGAHIGETCLTVTWEQLNIELLRLTGEERFAAQMERTIYNHLLGAQKPSGDDWCYFTPLEGRKPYDRGVNCCHSSGPRGVALIPSLVYATRKDGVAVNLFTPSEATLELPKGGSVRISQQTDLPFDGTVSLTLTPQGGPDLFTLSLRVPEWAEGISLAVNGDPTMNFKWRPGSYAGLSRAWKPGDRVTYRIEMRPRLLLGDHGNQGRAAVMFGPLALAADEGHNPDLKSLSRVTLAGDDPKAFTARRMKDASGKPAFEVEARVQGRDAAGTAPSRLVLVPYCEAGADGSRLQVWLRRPGTPGPEGGSLFAFAEQSRSRQGNTPGDICDGDPSTSCVTFDGTRQEQDWFAVALPDPVTINRVVYMHGHAFHDGGWFDASAGKPRIQVRRVKDGPWEDVASLDAYPGTSATEAKGLRDGQEFGARFAPVPAVALRIVGKPACGDNPKQAFSSCAELQAFNDR